MFWLFDKLIDSMTCFMLDIVLRESHAHLFKDDTEDTERKNKDTYIWDF
jgi:hypothetical protein